MKHQIVYLVVPVYESAPILWLRLRVSKERHHIVEVGYFAYRLFGLDIHDLCLGRRYGPECLDLSIVEA